MAYIANVRDGDHKITGIPVVTSGEGWARILGTGASNFTRFRPAYKSQPARIRRIDRIIPRIAIQVHAASIADRIGLQEAPEVRIIGAALFGVESGFGEPDLAGG